MQRFTNILFSPVGRSDNPATEFSIQGSTTSASPRAPTRIQIPHRRQALMDATAADTHATHAPIDGDTAARWPCRHPVHAFPPTE